MIVTVFKDIYSKENPHHVKVDGVLKAIKEGKYQDKIHQIRMCSDDIQKRKYKNDLVSICFSGKFTERLDSKCVQHSGLVVFDFDHVDQLKELKEKINKDEYTFASFISPSGDGLKVLIKIPGEINKHNNYYLSLVEKYKKITKAQHIDTTSQNISRVCFISYDPELYHNPQSKVWDIEKKTPEPINYFTPQKTDYNKINIIAEMIRNSVDGEKHHTLIKGSRLAGGFIAGGLIEEPEAIRVLEYEINNKNVDDFKAAQKAIQKGIDYGKKEPIYEENCKQRVEEIKSQDIIIKEEPAKDVIRCEDVADKIWYSYDHGVSRGETTHFPELDNHFRHKRGEITLVHGIGNHGKSAFLLQLLLIKAVNSGYKYGIFSPENMPTEEFYKDLIHMYIGKSPEKWHINRMNIMEMEKGIKFVNDHFFLIYPEETPTPKYINNRFNELKIKHGIDGCVIDPYNQLDHDLSKKGYREDQYISLFLTDAKKFAIQQNLFYYIVAHPKTGLKREGKDYECPQVFDLSGGAMWNNKADNIMVVHRPFYSSEKDNPHVEVKTQKIKKQKLNGVPGDVEFSYHRFQGRYYQKDEYSPFEEKKDNTQQINFNDQEVPF